MFKLLFAKIRIIFRAARIRVVALSRGSRISLGATIYIHAGARLFIGEGVRVGKGCTMSVLPGAVLELQDGSIINAGTFIYCASNVRIGKRTMIAHYCSILDHDYDIHSGDSFFDKPKVSESIIIGDNVWLGAYALILKGVTIGNNSVVGAQTMVKESVPEGMIAYCYSNSQLKMKNLNTKCNGLKK